MKIEDLQKGQKILVECEFDSFAGANQAWVLIQGKPELAQLDDIKPYQPKPVVPQFVADWYEEHKEDLEYDLYLYQMSIYDLKAKKDDFYYWMQKTNNPVHKLINMHQFGYTVKLYTVEILGNKLYKMTSDNHTRYRFFHKTEALPFYNFYEYSSKLTESEVKASDERLWQFAKEVTE